MSVIEDSQPEQNRTRIRFHVAYDGTDFCGWQRQNHGPLKSVGHTIEEALQKIFNEKIRLSASGRTDAGVHALNQVCHFETTRDLEKLKNWNFCRAINSQLPPSIVIKKAWIAPKEFHSTLSATHKTYRYLILNRSSASPFLRRTADCVRHPLDIRHLQATAQLIQGKHDFKSFQSVGTVVAHTVREIYQAEWLWRRPDFLQFTITGSGFLKQMVRNIVGTCLMLEKKKLDPIKMKEILMAQDRRAAGPPAPPQGLFLMRVYYPKDLDIRCIEL